MPANFNRSTFKTFAGASALVAFVMLMVGAASGFTGRSDASAPIRFVRQSPLLVAQIEAAKSDPTTVNAAQPVELMHNLPPLTTKKLVKSTPLTGGTQVIKMEVTAYCP